MAEFCQQCALKYFGPDIPSDFVGLLSEADHDKELVLLVLCEGCGPTEVDKDGKCVFRFCPSHGEQEQTEDVS